MTRKLKLSTAMLRGAKKHPKCKGEFYVFDKDDNIVACCAVGAAMVGAGAECVKFVNAQFPELNDANIYTSIIDRNDRKNWSRERIARWLKKKGL